MAIDLRRDHQGLLVRAHAPASHDDADSASTMDIRVKISDLHDGRYERPLSLPA